MSLFGRGKDAQQGKDEVSKDAAAASPSPPAEPSAASTRKAESAPKPPTSPQTTTTAPGEPASAGRSATASNTQGGASVANIGKSITIKGEMTGSEDVQVEGTIEGRVDLPSNEITIGPEGQCNAEVHAKTVIVIGRVKGNVTAVERIEVQAAGIVEGDVRAPRLIVHEGAVMNGSVEMGEVKPGDAPRKSTGSSASTSSATQGTSQGGERSSAPPPA